MIAVQLEDLGLVCRKNNYGFGYEIWAVDFLEKETDGEKYKSPQFKERIWYTSCKEQFDFLVAGFKQNTLTVDNLNDMQAIDDFEPMNLVLEQKHGDFHYLIRSEEGYMKAALKIVKQRHKEGWYTDGVKYWEDRIAKLGNLTLEAIAALPEALQWEAKKQAEEVAKAKRGLEKEQKRQQLVKLAVRENDTQAAVKALQAFNEDQYNRVSLQKFQGIY